MDPSVVDPNLVDAAISSVVLLFFLALGLVCLAIQALSK
jgi:hypothetical protein